VSTKLGLLLANENTLKKGLYKAWTKTVCPNITTTQSVELTGDFKAFVDGFDFSIFEAAAPLRILEQHRKTPYFVQRFGGGLPARPRVCNPTDTIEEHETVYTKKLFAVYSDHSGATIRATKDFTGHPKLRKHFNRSREAFYHSEALRVFVRDKTEPGTFESRMRSRISLLRHVSLSKPCGRIEKCSFPAPNVGRKKGGTWPPF